MSRTAPRGANLIGPNPIDLRRIISQRIHALGWTIEKAATRAGMRPQDLSAYLNATRHGIHVDTTVRLLMSLGAEPVRWSDESNQSTFPVWEKQATPEYLQRMAGLDGEARRIENALTAAGMSQAELSVRSGVHTSRISRLLTRRGMPSPAAMAAIEAILCDHTAGPAAKKRKRS